VISGDCAADGSVTLDPGDVKSCTITNDDLAPSLTLIKHVTNDNGGTAAATDWTLQATGPTSLSGTTPVSSGPSFDAGTYTLSEDGPAGYASTGWTCTGGTQDGVEVTVGLGQSATCEITNDDIAPSLTLIKHVTNDNGGTAVATDWTLKANGGPTPISGAGGVSSGATFKAGTYTLSETTGPAGYSAGAWSCSGTGSQSGSSITLDIGQSATCEITNDDIAPKLIVIKHVINNDGGTATAKDFTMLVTGPSAEPSSFPGAESPGTTVNLNAGSYSVSEDKPIGPRAYAATYSSDCTGSIAVGQTKTCTVTNNDLPLTLVTDTGLCTFDIDSSRTGSQFRNILTPDPTSPNSYKLNATNPGQYYYNVFYNAGGGAPTQQTLHLTLPYPFVTQGAVPVHVYSSVTTTTANGATCITPGTDITSSSTIETVPVTLSDYSPQAFGSTTTVDVTFTSPTNFVYINIHVDYGLKGTVNLTKGGPSGNDALDKTTLATVVPDLQSYTFSASNGVPIQSATVQSENVFKKDPGIAGLVQFKNTEAPVAGATVQIYQGTKQLMATVSTDDDGWFMWQYKYTGKPTTFTVKLPQYNLTQSLTLKSNALVVMSILI
jgi:hypothetical protein